ncbi:MAG: S-adenosylmethionine:tRNA ribosyltransferase-isomerase, partial [Treponema sp.]|nr:S-adenosylmethionine:tRNA ribosyltransferase-isomerase [Treponema sp.]
MKTNGFNFVLPENLIAQYPPAERGRSRLLLIDRKNRRLEHRMVRDLPSIVELGTVMVFNNSRVRRARLLGMSEATGANAEFLLIKKLDANTWQAMAKRSKRLKPGNRYVFADANAEIFIVQNEGTVILNFDRPIDDAWLDVHGHVPLPPYIKRDDTNLDWERYQTVYANGHGSVAAPTAGLHFTDELLGEIERAGIEMVFITLHVGLGTFLPVRTENIEDHKMHEETYYISDETASRIE